LRDAAAINALRIPDVDTSLRYVTDAITRIRQALAGSVPLIGFAGSPWTLATYMVEGGSSKDFRHIKALAYDQPALLEQLLSKTASAVTDYLNAQVEAGAQALMIFDTWGGALAHDVYPRFSLAFAEQIIDGLIRERDGQRIPVVFFTKGGAVWLERIADCGADALGVDWTISLTQARARVGNQVSLQGNLDPSILYAEPSVIEREVERVLAEFGHGSGHVFNLGHGVHPQIEPDHVKAMVDAVHRLSPVWHE
jgi:uroporphyrinogen decarboxylase